MYSTVFIEKGKNGWGGPLLIEPNEEKDKIVSITGGGIDEVTLKIAQLTGAVAVDGYNEAVTDEETACVVIDCGGMLRCGLYPKKEIPTINLVAVGQSGPFKEFMTKENYVSGVTPDNVFRVDSLEIFDIELPEPVVSNKLEEVVTEAEEVTFEADTKKERKPRIKVQRASLTDIVIDAGKDAVDSAIRDIIPFMLFFALIAGAVMYTGLGDLMKEYLFPYLASVPGLLILAFICSIPLISAKIGSNALVGQLLSVLIGIGIALGAVPVYLALPALFAVNAQAGCDLISDVLTLGEADENDREIGQKAVLIARLLTGPGAVLIVLFISLWLYGLL
ncbi:PTS sorbitol transporter subunit IIB [Eubacteriaceae bacterium ES3]|nr:PTS sorbitol transporter subunit IIB [Eubacteriaceae bacterium ES3]